MIALTIRDADSISNEIVHLGHASATTCNAAEAETLQTQLPRNLTLHLGHEGALVERAKHSSDLAELVLAPVELHQRNIQRRLRESQVAKDGVRFADPTEVGERILDCADLPTTTIDRIDRLSMIRSILSNDEVSITSPALTSDPQVVEQARTEIENVTGFHPERIKIFRDAANELAGPIDADGTEILSAAINIQRALRHRTSKSISGVELTRHATRRIFDSDGKVWEEVFPKVDSVSLVGGSSIPSAHIDLLHAVLNSVSVPVHIHFRGGTGSYLSRRVSEMFDVAEPGAVVFGS